MKLHIEEPPRHAPACDTTDACPACRWIRERLAEDEALQCFILLARFYPQNMLGMLGPG